ncbi:spore coat protein U [Mesorhizobium sp. L-8-10]|uniref:Csu type fimbrial protein n=1 Tax=unclassified Mesorhizobium TaxID=325217 RepID=UPI0019354AA9|nr:MULTISPECIES: spore coat U domain-containing protein [unclassified Mesorhizobium]BCH21123.1 spore coat protein U [Mesorhizobium sp. L-8-3]BCH28965.1 spore coat protein U [Mesorhizobium sp. L-8-10]
MFDSNAFGQTATTQFNVTITITSSCQINSASNMDFGSTGVISAAIPATGTIAVQCTNGTPYTVGLNNGATAGGTIAVRKMAGPSAQTVDYSLYKEAGHTNVWGDTGADLVSGTGDGSAQNYTVYGQVPVQPTPGAGTYNDTITVTVTY